MKKIGIVALTILSLLLTGCLGLFGVKNVLGEVFVRIEFSPEVETAHIELVEVVLEKGQEAYLLLLTPEGDFQERASLPAGNWQCSAQARNGDGYLVGNTERESVLVTQNRSSVLSVTVNSCEPQILLPAVSGLSASLDPEGVLVSWDVFHEPGMLEIYSRSLEGKLWKRVGRVSASDLSFLHNTAEGHLYEYTIRYLSDGGYGGPLHPKVAVSHALLGGTISFKHQFPEIPQISTGRRLVRTQSTVSDMFDDGQFDDLIIHFYSEEAFSRRYELLKAEGLEILREMPSLQAVLAKPGPNSPRSLEEWSTWSGEDYYVEPNLKIMRPLECIPNDLYYSEQWTYPLIRLPRAWQIHTGNSSIRIGVLDTGIDPNHPDLRGRVDVDGGYNFVDRQRDTSDKHGHGTHVAGIIGAVTNNNQGVAGVMWDVTLVPIKVLSDSGAGTISDLADGILYAAGLYDHVDNPNPVHLINLSLGAHIKSDLLQDAVEQVATKTDIIMVAASGNDGSQVMNPAAYEEVIAVGSVEPNQRGEPTRADYSNYGPEVELAAFGGTESLPILSTGLGSGFAEKWGTSMAAPHVSGVIGLMLSNGIHPSAVRSILQTTAVDLGPEGRDDEYGCGLVNAYWAVSGVQNLKIIVGKRVGDQIEAAAQSLVPLGVKEIPHLAVPQGTYEVYAWLDLGDAGRIDSGDYIFQSSLLHFEEDGQIDLDMILEEVQ